MRTIYRWRIKRSGNAVTVIGIEAGASVKLAEISEVNTYAGSVYAYNMQGRAVALLAIE